MNGRKFEKFFNQRISKTYKHKLNSNLVQIAIEGAQQWGLTNGHTLQPRISVGLKTKGENNQSISFWELEVVLDF